MRAITTRGTRYRPHVGAEWAAWSPSVVVFLGGVVALAALVAVVLRQTTRVRRELTRFLASVRTSTARLRSGGVDPNTARDRDRAGDVGRIRSVPTKGE
jgi:hypothetical protein